MMRVVAVVAALLFTTTATAAPVSYDIEMDMRYTFDNAALFPSAFTPTMTVKGRFTYDPAATSFSFLGGSFSQFNGVITDYHFDFLVGGVQTFSLTKGPLLPAFDTSLGLLNDPSIQQGDLMGVVIDARFDDLIPTAVADRSINGLNGINIQFRTAERFARFDNASGQFRYDDPALDLFSSLTAPPDLKDFFDRGSLDSFIGLRIDQGNDPDSFYAIFGDIRSFERAATAVPEPETALMMLIGLAGLGGIGRHHALRRR